MSPSRIGSTGIEVSPLGFGSAPIGNLYRKVDDDTAVRAVNAAWEAGVRYFDTAPHYGLGLAERRLGRALRERPRAEYAVSSKVGRLLVPNERPTGDDLANGFAVPDDLRRELDYSPSGVRRGIEESLTRLGLDRLDIVLVHDPDECVDTVVRETIPALCRLRDEKLVGAVGVGMNYWRPLRRIARETDVDVVMVAGRWTLLDRSAEPLLDACAERGVSVLAAAPFNSGILAREEPTEADTFDYAPVDAEVLSIARELAASCRAHGATLPQAALQFAPRHPAVAAVVAGFADEAQVRTAAAWMGAAVSEDAWSELYPAKPLPAGAFDAPPRQGPAHQEA